MKTTKIITSIALTAITSLSFVACGDDDGGPDECNPVDAADCPLPPDMGPPAVVYTQVEHLGRPGIAEALLISNGFLAGYNATAPTFTGVPMATLNMVVGEAKVVLKAIYYGACFINGAITPPLTAATGLQPGRVQCPEVGGAILENGQIKGTVAAAAQTYADLVFDQFEPDVMRIDTGAASGYLTLCGGPSAKPLLCGGRLLGDDVIDITYNYLLSGALVGAGSAPQFQNLVSDGVSYNGSNDQQGNPALLGAFPYSAPPI